MTKGHKAETSSRPTPLAVTVERDTFREQDLDTLALAEKSMVLGWYARHSLSALVSLERLYNQHPSDVFVALQLVDVYSHLGRKRAAEDILRHTVLHHLHESKPPKPPTFYGSLDSGPDLSDHYLAADLCFRLGLRREAASVCLRALNLDPNGKGRSSADIQWLMASLLIHGRAWSRLRSHAAEHLVPSQGGVLAHWVLAWAHLRCHDIAPARDTFLFGTLFAESLADQVLSGSLWSRDRRLLSMPESAPSVRELMDLVSPKPPLTWLFLASVQFCQADHPACVQSLDSVLSAPRDQWHPSSRRIAAEMHATAMARRMLGQGSAHRFYREAARFAPASRTRLFSLMASLDKWDSAFAAIITGPSRATSLLELGQRIATSRSAFLDLWKSAYPKDRTPSSGSGEESEWCRIKYSCVDALMTVLNLKSNWMTKHAFRLDYSTLVDAGLQSIADGVAAMESFADRFAAIASHKGYRSLSQFTAHEQTMLLHALTPASCLDGVFTASQSQATADWNSLLAKVDILTSIVKSMTHPIAVSHPKTDGSFAPIAAVSGDHPLPAHAPVSPPDSVLGRTTSSITVWRSSPSGIGAIPQALSPDDLRSVLDNEKFYILVHERKVLVRHGDSTPVSLGFKGHVAYNLLVLLLCHKDKDLDAKELYRRAWNTGYGGEPVVRNVGASVIVNTSLSSPICRWRKRIGQPFLITSVPSVGYRCEGDFTFLVVPPRDLVDLLCVQEFK